MAEENTQETEKKSPLKIILFSVGGLVLLGIGLGLGIFMGGDKSDPSSEISQIIEKKENPDAENTDESKNGKEEAEEECAEEEKDEEGNCPSGPKKMPKVTPEEEIFATTYYEFPGNFTTNLKGSKKFLQISLGVSTQYDDQVMANVDSHQLALRSEILTIMSEFSSEDISGRTGKQELAGALKNGINNVLEKVEGFGGVENVHFTSFVLQ
ncbi:MAG: flagellar biosynthesis protein FliL [Rickettsiales bacterium]|nr:flagellar biosynthesis protein FliL [Rickettsiales bacterium]|tara:strand:+ start:1298 stop:1930 length:633 start_codon:yes stop_codon:yes gene_type:complete